MRVSEHAEVRADVDGIAERAARHTAFADKATDCVAELRSGGFGQWWRDGRTTALNTQIADIADRLAAAASEVDAFTAGLRRTVTDLAVADAEAAREFEGLG